MRPHDGPTSIAYAQCEVVTRLAAANFYYGIRLLPQPKRLAMCAVYAFARRVDDIGDGALPAPEKLRQLDTALTALTAVDDPGFDPVMVALADAKRHFELPMDALDELVEGVRMDVVGDTYEDFDQLHLYCRRVAGTIGRLCLSIFGSRDPTNADRLADDLGIAMQLTNIIRDIGEDARNGRVYLPREDIERYHLSEYVDPQRMAELAATAAHAEPQLIAGRGGEDVGQLFALMRFQACRAEEWFERGLPLVGLLDRRSGACVLAMSGIYRRVLGRVSDRPDQALCRRTSLGVTEKAWVAACSLAGKGA